MQVQNRIGVNMVNVGEEKSEVQTFFSVLGCGSHMEG